MNTGLTIAFICNGKDHPTMINYKKFGNQYWDDSQNNNSKIGYYFAYYFQQKYVYIHKIINILQPIERPSEMDWSSDRQILCLSEQLKKFTWNEWITGIGLGSPYTPSYRMTQTGSWSYNELQNHAKYHQFQFINFKNAIEQQTTNIAPPLSYESEDEDDIDAQIAELIRQKEAKKIAKNNERLIAIRAEKDKLLGEKDHELYKELQKKRTEFEALEIRITIERQAIKDKRDAIKAGLCDDELNIGQYIKDTP